MTSSLLLSFKVALVATLFSGLFGITAGYILAVKKFRGKTGVDILVTLPMILPPTVTGYYLVILLGRNGLLGKFIYENSGYSVIFSWHAAVVASFVVSVPLMIKSVKSAVEAVDESYINAAYSLGYSEVETALKIVLPLAIRGIISGLVLSFARAIGEFGATLMLAGNIEGKTDTMPLSIYSAVSSGEWESAHLLVFFLTLSSGVFLYASIKLTGRKRVSLR